MARRNRGPPGTPGTLKKNEGVAFASIKELEFFFLEENGGFHRIS